MYSVFFLVKYVFTGVCNLAIHASSPVVCCLSCSAACHLVVCRCEMSNGSDYAILCEKRHPILCAVCILPMLWYLCLITWMKY